MLPAALTGQMVTIVRTAPPTQDDAGNMIPGDVTRTHVSGCLLAPLQGTASTEAVLATADRIVTRWMLYTNPGVDVFAADQVQQSADRVSPVLDDSSAHLNLQVDGDPDEWYSTGTGLDHREVYLRRWEG